MQTDKGNEPAFGYGFTTADGSSHAEEKGLNKREYFAALNMQGLLTKYNLKTPEDQETIAQLSVELADELIKQLNQ